jgi:hypothetical protein
LPAAAKFPVAVYGPASCGGVGAYVTGCAPRLAPPAPVADAVHGAWSAPLKPTDAGHVTLTVGVAKPIEMVAVAVAVLYTLLPAPHVTVRVYEPAFVGTEPSPL